MALLEYIPLEVHIDIARYLPLRDALAYANVNTLAHDAVYYIFSHRSELNFASLLDDKDCIALTDAEIMNVLHAHVRATSIVALSLRCSFSMFAELESYFSMYWRVLINQRDEQVGHPSGNLQYVGYLHYYGLQHGAPKENLARMAALCDRYEPYDEYLSCFENRGLCGEYSFTEPYNNWSNIDLDIRYKPCPCCHLSTFASSEVCEGCEITCS